MVTENGVLESWSNGGTPDHARRRMPTSRVNYVAAAGLRPSRAPGKSQGRCGKRPYRASDGVIRSGPRRYASRAFTGLSGRKAGKARNFYRLALGFDHLTTALTRLGPDDSTQVVDFPHLGSVRLFWEGKNSPWGRDAEKKPQRYGDTGYMNIGDQRGAQRSARPTLKITEN